MVSGTAVRRIGKCGVAIGFLLLLPGLALAGGKWIVTDVTVSNSVQQTGAGGTNIFMGKVGIGTNAPSEALSVHGNVVVDGTNSVGALTLGGETRSTWPASYTDANSTNAVLMAWPNLDVDGTKSLSKAGGTMTGNINMNNLKITSLGSAVDDGDAVSKQYLDARLLNIEPIGNLDMGSYTNRP